MSIKLLPDAILLTGVLRVNHDGVVYVIKLIIFKRKLYKSFGNVQLVQGDTYF
jgi:hypothetical protein